MRPLMPLLMPLLGDRFRVFISSRWFVFAAALWVQSCAGIGYLFGSISPVIKTSLGYNQKQLARLGVAKDLGDNVGFIAGILSEVLPLWGVLFVGVLQNLVGYGWVWLIITGRLPTMPLWVMCILIFVGTNGETYFNTAALVSGVQNFPNDRGSVVGILKGFSGLSGAIFTQIYATIKAPKEAALIFMFAVGPSMVVTVVTAMMFFVRPVEGHRQSRPSDGLNFKLIYGVCVILGAYLMVVMIVEDIVDLNYTVITSFTILLFILLLLPIVLPIISNFSSEQRPIEESLLHPPHTAETSTAGLDVNETIRSEQEEVDSLPVSDLPELVGAAAGEAVRVERRGPRIGEDFTLKQALEKTDFWLIFFSLLLGSGSGLTVIDNLGQMSESLGYDKTHVFVSMISIWNFLGRVAGGYVSEIIVRNYAYPRSVAMAIAQGVMAFGHLYFAMGWPGVMYVGTPLVGLGYGAHWAIVPSTASELFGLKKFAALYNFLTLANPAGSLVFSGLIASSIYDYEAEKQSQMRHQPHHNSHSLHRMFDVAVGVENTLKCKGTICFYHTYLIMSGMCIIAVILSSILTCRTKIVYERLYGSSHNLDQLENAT